MLLDKRSTPPPKSPHLATLDDADPPSLAAAYRAGELIGDKYQLLRLLGEGGMGVVWLARNTALDSEVAIKLLRAGTKSKMLERRMLKEAQAVARLGHPAILRVFDFGTSPRGDPYMVMELLDGEDLAHTLASNGRLSAIKAVRTLLPVLHALSTAHHKGIIHRDLKPDNIFLTATDSGYVQPKVVDFGIVKTNEPELDRLTRIGAVLGTPAYLSPEQARGEDVDQRTDVWSSAVVLYEMLTCRLPFEGGNYNALMRSIIEDMPPPITNFCIGDAELWRIIERGLAKRAAERWPSMGAFGGALAAWLLARGESDDISGASLRAAWQQGPTAARAADLYSGPPNSSAQAQYPGSRNATVGDDPVNSEPKQVAPGAQAVLPRGRLFAGAAMMIAVVVGALLWRGFEPNASRSGPAPSAAQGVAPANTEEPSTPRTPLPVAASQPTEATSTGEPEPALSGVAAPERPVLGKHKPRKAPPKAFGGRESGSRAPDDDLKTSL